MSPAHSWTGSLLQPLLPSFLFVCSVLTAVATLHFKVHIRPFFLPPSILFAIGSIWSTRKDPDSWVPPAFSFCLGLTAFYQLLWLPILLCSTKYPPNGSATYSSEEASRSHVSFSFQSFTEAYRQWNNPRGLAIGPGVRHPPGLTRTSFVAAIVFTCRRALKIVLLHLINNQIAQPVFGNIMSRAMLVDFAPESESLIRRMLFNSPTNTLDWDQFAVRALTSWYWIWHDYLTLETCHAALAILFVAILGLDSADEWPPLYGNLFDAWSVKRFWGRYWHRIMTSLYSRYACLFSRAICRTRAGSFPDKVLVAFGVFALSGLGHVVVNWRHDEVALARDMLFFMANFAAVAVEVCISRAAKAALGRMRYESVIKSWQTVLLGHIWVCFWFVWIVPRWEFPRTYNEWIQTVGSAHIEADV